MLEKADKPAQAKIEKGGFSASIQQFCWPRGGQPFFERFQKERRLFGRWILARKTGTQKSLSHSRLLARNFGTEPSLKRHRIRENLEIPCQEIKNKPLRNSLSRKGFGCRGDKTPVELFAAGCSEIEIVCLEQIKNHNNFL